MNAAITAIGIALDYYKSPLFSCRSESVENCSKVDKKVKTVIAPVFTQFGVDPKRIKLFITDDESSPYASSGSLEGTNTAKIYISRKEHNAILASASLSARTMFCIGHEIAHLVADHMRSKVIRKERRKNSNFIAGVLTAALFSYYRWNAGIALIAAKIASIGFNWLSKNTHELQAQHEEEFEADLFAAITPEFCEGGIAFFTERKEKYLSYYHSMEGFCRQYEGVFWELQPSAIKDYRRGINDQGEWTWDRTHPPLSERIAKLQERLASFTKSN